MRPPINAVLVTGGAPGMGLYLASLGPDIDIDIFCDVLNVVVWRSPIARDFGARVLRAGPRSPGADDRAELAAGGGGPLRAALPLRPVALFSIRTP